MTYGEKYKEVFGYYPERIPCPAKCIGGYKDKCCKGCEFLNITTQTVFRKEEAKNEKKEDDRQSDRRNLSSVDIYHYLRTADPCEYGVIFSLAFFKLAEAMTYEDLVNMTLANLFASSGSFDAEVMYKAQDMILKHYGGGDNNVNSKRD